MDDSMNGHSMNPLQDSSLVMTDRGDPALALGPLGPGPIDVLPLEALDRMEVCVPRVNGALRLVNYGTVARALVGLGAFLRGHGVVFAALLALSGCGLAGPVGVPGPVGTTHGAV